MKNLQIESLRGIMMLVIMFYNYTYRFSGLYSIKTIDFFSLEKLGTIGVGAFFVISGYFIIPKDLSHFNFISFFTKKIARLYPAYFVCVTLTFISISLFGLPERGSRLIDYIINLTLLNGYIGVRYVDGAHWYLANLILFYVIIGVAMQLKIKKDYLFFVWLALSIILAFFSVRYFSISYAYIITGGKFTPYCIIGIVLSEIQNDRANRIKYMFLIIIASVYIFFQHGVVTSVGSLIFLSIFILALKKEFAVLKLRPLVWLGTISYIVYLLHQNIGYQLLLFMTKIFHGFHVSYIIYTMVIVLLLSYLVSLFIQQTKQYNIMRVLKKFFVTHSN